jgi:hypothetical protein
MNRLKGKGFILAGLVAVLMLVMPITAIAGVDVNISVPLFELFGFVQQPVVVAPAPYGYAPSYGYAPNGYYVAPPAPAGAVFYGGYWYLPSGGSWYIAAQTGGPWVSIGMDRVPYAVISGPVLMPRTYSSVPRGPAVGVTINPWINIGGYGGHRHGYDD